MTLLTKQCTKCKKIQAVSEFNLDNKTKDKLTCHCKTCQFKNKIKYRSTKHGFLTKALYSAKTRAKNKNVPIDLDFEYIKSIATDMCPIFNVPLIYFGTTKGSGNTQKNTASLDRIIPELGYVKDNVVFISHWANTIKSNATEKELYAVADWLHEARKNVIKKTTTSVPTGSHIPGAVGAELGSVSTPWTWEDSDDAHHHCGADARKDSDSSAEASSRNSMGHGD